MMNDYVKKVSWDRIPKNRTSNLFIFRNRTQGIGKIIIKPKKASQNKNKQTNKQKQKTKPGS